MTDKSILPDKPSALIHYAVESLEEAKGHPNFELDLGVWVAFDRYETGTVCRVCVGAAAALRAGQSPDPNDTQDENFRRKIIAIAHFADGENLAGLQEIGLPEPICELIIDSYNDDGEFMPDINQEYDLFKDRLLDFANHCESKGY